MKFYVDKKGGIRVKDAGGETIYHLFEGTKEKGPWYESGQYPEFYVKMWMERGDIKSVPE